MTFRVPYQIHPGRNASTQMDPVHKRRIYKSRNQNKNKHDGALKSMKLTIVSSLQDFAGFTESCWLTFCKIFLTDNLSITLSFVSFRNCSSFSAKPGKPITVSKAASVVYEKIFSTLDGLILKNQLQPFPINKITFELDSLGNNEERMALFR